MTERVRHAARALIVAPDRSVLLMRLKMPHGSFWLTPGGGLQAGESARDGLARELLEETGRDDLPIGPEVWRRTVPYSVEGQSYRQHERYFLVLTERFDAHTNLMPDEPERRWFDGYRWWHTAEIGASEERFAPRRLSALLPQLLRDGPPVVPLDTGL